ncbi:hypothetical protein LINPERPRIM_LOCUS4910 [Linum perenne]
MISVRIISLVAFL